MITRPIAGAAASILLAAAFALPADPADEGRWPQFRGPASAGVKDGAGLPASWNAVTGEGVVWKTRIPGLAHSSPVVWGDRVFVTTAVSSRPDATFKPGLYGDGTASEDRSVHEWKVLSLDLRTGKVLWERTAHRGEPREKRHIKATYANHTPATDGRHVVAFFGSQGLFAYDVDGTLKWSRDLGRLDAGAYDAPSYEWGTASSPILYEDLVLVQCDQQKGSFLVALRLADGSVAWRTGRDELPSWATPNVHPGGPDGRPELVTNAPKFIRGYDPSTGEELWRLGRSSNITAPTPVFDKDLIVVMSGRRPNAPIFVLKAGARGDITLPEGATGGGPVLWTKERAGAYMPTPLVYRGLLYVLKNQGILSCYDLASGELKYEQRLPEVAAGFSASPVAADGRLYLPSEDGEVLVVEAGPEFRLLSRHPVGQPLMASPAIAGGLLLLRGEQDLFAVGAVPPRVHQAAGMDVELAGELGGFTPHVSTRRLAEGLEVLSVRLESATPQRPPRFSLKWSVPSHDVAGQWTTGRHLNKTIRPDWAGSRFTTSMFAREAPVSALFGSADQNVLTFAASDALNTVRTGSGIREEDGRIYNEVVFFDEPHESLAEYTVELRLDRRAVPYWTALREVGEWWAARPAYTPAPVPEPARLPAYSTWYNFHQSVDSKELLLELALARPMGFESIIVDDGWQTLDTRRGYAFTGDWEPERMPDMKAFVEGAHHLGVKVLLWYAVPFVGKNAKAAERFKDKSLRFDERLGAYVLDPRFPEVRAHVISTYRKALQDWGIDGFKLDFIERFTADDKTVLTATGGRDYASVNEATDRMMTDVMAELRRARPDVMIEFRQPYIGPLIRKYGNMFRASDCPNSYLANRVKTVDLRLLSGTTAVHADMVMWHPEEPVEIAALQLANVVFSVPQLSVRLREIPKDHAAMVAFYTRYWNENRGVLLDGDFEARNPGANYPVVVARRGGRRIVGLYADVVVDLDGPASDAVDVVNGKNSRSVVLSAPTALGAYRYTTRDAQGQTVGSGRVTLAGGPHAFDVPVSGILALERAR